MPPVDCASLLRRAACALALCLLAWSAPLHAQSGAPLERQVKAAYLYNFGTFVDWPEDSFERPDSPLQIGVAGNDALADQVEQMVAGRSVKGHAVVIRKIRRGDPLSGLHILYVGAQERAVMSEFFNAARGQSLLTVSDAEDGLALGSMVNFVVADDRLRFEVALPHVTPSRLRISARMLAAAYRVRGVS